MVLHLIPSDSKSPQFSRTLLSILVDLNNAVVWMISTCLLISTSSIPFTEPFVTLSSRRITICIIATFMHLLLFIPIEFFT